MSFETKIRTKIRAYELESWKVGEVLSQQINPGSKVCEFLRTRVWVFGVVLFLPLNVSAFFSNENLERVEKRVQVEMVDTETLKVQIHERIKNVGKGVVGLRIFEALPESAENVEFFLDARAENFEVSKEEESLNLIFDQAKQNSDARFFRMAVSPFSKFFQTSEFKVPLGSTVLTKISFEQKIDFVDDFFFSEIFLNDEIPAKRFEITLAISSGVPIYNFFTNLPPVGILDRSTFQITYLFEKSDFMPSENFRFFWSNVSKPVLKFSTGGFYYFGHFLPLDSPRIMEESKNVTFLIDQSGSMTGQTWERTKDFLHKVLENLDNFGEKNVRIAFFDEELRFYKLEFQKNSFEFRKEFFEMLGSVRPLGKSDLNLVLQEVQADAPEDHVLVLLTDEDSFSLENYFQNIAKRSPTIVLNFAEEEQSLENLGYFSGGFYQRLFRSATSLIEWDEFWDKLVNWRKGVFGQDVVVPEEGEVEVLPKNFKSFSQKNSAFFVGRKQDQYPKLHANSANFLPRVWAARRMAEILSMRDFSTNNLDALLAIGRTFGVSTSFLNENTLRDELSLKLRDIDYNDLYREVLDLENSQTFSFKTEARFFGEVPVYFVKKENLWRSFNYFDRAKTETLIEISPFSEAQRELFVSFADILAEGFGIASNVEFCTEFRCLSVKDDQRLESVNSDRMFFRDFNPNHWANSYLIRAVEKGLI
ncbi:MAG: VWA domain-containing protein, partial [Candidatus Peregrinibacteria bacterium]|nr:VWA domain-containing protein [Candidatus Peregrinibacteria bacterium]